MRCSLGATPYLLDLIGAAPNSSRLRRSRSSCDQFTTASGTTPRSRRHHAGLIATAPAFASGGIGVSSARSPHLQRSAANPQDGSESANIRRTASFRPMIIKRGGLRKSENLRIIFRIFAPFAYAALTDIDRGATRSRALLLSCVQTQTKTRPLLPTRRGSESLFDAPSQSEPVP